MRSLKIKGNDMVKVYRFGEEPLTYSEQWAVKYRILEGEFWTKKTVRYSTYSKGENAYNAVLKRFKKDFPLAQDVKINYL